jgi:hypothetical protein
MSDVLDSGPLCCAFAATPDEAASRTAGIARWWRDLAESLGGRVPATLPWSEEPSQGVQRFELGPRGLDAVRLAAVYAGHPELELPELVPEPLWLDPAWRRAEGAGFARSPYGHLLAAQCWLPIAFDFTAKVPRPDGEDWSIGSLPVLHDQLGRLAQQCFGVSPQSLDDLKRLADPFLALAGPALAAFERAARTALAARVPLCVSPRPADLRGC